MPGFFWYLRILSQLVEHAYLEAYLDAVAANEAWYRLLHHVHSDQ